MFENSVFPKEEQFYSACRLLEILLSRAEERADERECEKSE